MKVPLPILRCPTPESRRAALIDFRRHGLHWGVRADPLEDDMIQLAKWEATGFAMDRPYWYLDGHHLHLGPEVRATLKTPVNSVSHFISYIKRHHLWTPPTNHV